MTNLNQELTAGPLAEEIAPYILSGQDGVILSILNRKDISRLGKISSHSIKQYFSLIDLRIPIKDSQAASCRAVSLALEDFPTFDLTIPEVQAKFIAMLDDLVEEELIPDFTEVHKATLLYLATETISRAEELGINPTENDIAVARLGGN
jgi:hypothetical protein